MGLDYERVDELPAKKTTVEMSDGPAGLASSRFRTVIAGEAVSLTGDTAYVVAFAWLVLDQTGSAATLGLALLAGAVPRAILLLVGGATSDRYSPRTIMLASHLGRAAVVTVVCVLTFSDNLDTWALFATSALFGVADAFFYPASNSVLPLLVPDHELARANAVTVAVQNVAQLIGPLIAGVLIAVAETSLVLALNALTFFVAAATVVAVPARSVADTDDEPTALLQEVVDSVPYVLRRPEMRVVLALISVATLSYSGLFAVGLPAYARSLPEGSVALGMLLTAWFAGQVLGTTAASFTGLPARWGMFVMAMTTIEGLAFLLLAFRLDLILAAAVLMTLGVGVAYSSDVALPTFIQLRTPPLMLGRVNSVMELPRVVLEPISLAVMGVIAGVRPSLAFLFASIPLLILGSILASRSSVRSLRLERHGAEAGETSPT